MLGLEGEQELVGNGLSFCAVCDGAFYTGQEVAMIGGGNSALQEALLLSEVCKKVTVVQNLADFTGEKKLSDALLEKYVLDSGALWDGHGDCIRSTIIGSVIGTHAGPGAIAVAFFHP
jgi:thioredoxin reductase